MHITPVFSNVKTISGYFISDVSDISEYSSEVLLAQK